MPNVYFDNFTDFAEQSLIDELCAESISIYGHTVYYIPRELINKDLVFNEDSLSRYKDAIELDMYIRSFDSFQGDGTFLSRFNLEVRDQITFTVARSTFRSEVGTRRSEIQRPREGDLIYSTMIKRFFVIKFVNNQAIFYQLGDLQVWDVVCDTWEYSNEVFDTGNSEIDSINDNYSFATNEPDPPITDEKYKEVLGPFQQNDVFQAEGEPIIDWSEQDPFSEGNV